MLQLSNVDKVYNHVTRALHVLRDINLTVQKGEMLSIIGPSGAGKSTLLHIMGGLDAPTRGKVLLEEKNIYRLADHQRAKIRNEKIGFIFQFYHLLPEFNALENVLLPAAVKKNTGATSELREKALAILEAVGLKKRAYHRPNQLSGGEQQRVAIARALINDPDVLLCDEPTGNLDSKNGQEIISILRSMNKENKRTIVLVTHDEKIARVSHRIMHIRDGQFSNEKK